VGLTRRPRGWGDRGCRAGAERGRPVALL